MRDDSLTRHGRPPWNVFDDGELAGQPDPESRGAVADQGGVPGSPRDGLRFADASGSLAASSMERSRHT
jgi:hypothetical protein